MLETPPVDWTHIFKTGKNPPIFLSMIPKSASEYICDMISVALNAPKLHISPRYFPNNLVLRPEIRRLVMTGGVAKDHLPASPLNLRIINAYLDRLVVQVRDPRQIILSWLHHLTDCYKRKEYETLLIFDPPFPPGFFSMSFEQQLDWKIDHILPLLVLWIEEWLEAESKAWFKPRILFTRYEDFQQDSEGFIRTILEFYDIDQSRYNVDLIRPRQRKHHFRKGIVEEWREVFSPPQVKRATSLIPEKLSQRFHWTR
jgi:hypothetical protein